MQETRRIYRQPDQRWLGGVSAGLAAHLGVDVALIRTVFAATSLVGGMGVLAYALMWLFFPMANEPASPAGRPVRSRDLTGLLGMLALGLGGLLALGVIGVPVEISVWAPLLLLAGGVAVIWMQSDDARMALRRARSVAEATDTPTLTIRLLVGCALLGLGLLVLVLPRVDLLTVTQIAVAMAALVAGVAVIGLPWLSGWLRGRQEERAATIRAQERAAMAAVVHDSVLQTLALIQLRSGDPEVIRLARTEERALRSWLYDPGPNSGTFVAALSGAVRAVEADYNCRVDVVTVGDAALDARLEGLVAATREAVVNSAKHSGAPASVFAEVTAQEVEVNVRDRGRGFDPQSVPGDRHGLRESVIARVESLGGAVVVISEPQVGTEVRMTLPREARS